MSVRDTSPGGARPNPYLPMSMRVARITDETDDRTIKSFELAFTRPEDAADFRHIPGQFCELSLLGVGEAPFGIASAPCEAGLRFTVKHTGVVTAALHGLAAGDVVGVRGPLGNGFPMAALRGRDLVGIGGGFAFTTLRALIVELLADGRDQYGHLTVIYGARTPGLLMYRNDLAAWAARGDVTAVPTIDQPAEGWGGRVGFVPTVLGEVAPSAENATAIICGPPAMIRFTLPVLTRLGFGPEQVYTSLENRMKCGVGKCGRCNVGHKYVCLDGPVFSLAELGELPPDY